MFYATVDFQLTQSQWRIQYMGINQKIIDLTQNSLTLYPKELKEWRKLHNYCCSQTSIEPLNINQIEEYMHQKYITKLFANRTNLILYHCHVGQDIFIVIIGVNFLNKCRRIQSSQFKTIEISKQSLYILSYKKFKEPKLEQKMNQINKLTKLFKCNLSDQKKLPEILRSQTNQQKNDRSHLESSRIVHRRTNNDDKYYLQVSFFDSIIQLHFIFHRIQIKLTYDRQYESSSLQNGILRNYQLIT
ncbi:unnamed protein product [Paramecium octaurelia]|uniref:Uncharacterized protein n=1 Tax=Paramecium octaurelia TaxID=43137 RepID=A0A8S1W4X9_PAROT|nr:unnamed protein product [Paramecium octaurelia]